MNLEEENKRLKSQLEAARSWMKREVNSAEKDIALHKSQKDTNNLYHDNLEEIIQDKIYGFFPAEVLSCFPVDAVENIISSELIYYHILQGWHVDGTGVMIWYQKVLDAMIEMYVTKWFRKYIKKNNISSHPKNIPLEKAFYSLIEKKYILSLWRLYESLKKIKKWEDLSEYLWHFRDYLKSRDFLYKSLLESNFLLQLESLIHLHAISDKRHSGSLSPDDTQRARNACIWNFEDTTSLLYILASSQSVDI